MKKLIIIGILSMATTLGAGVAINTSHAMKSGKDAPKISQSSSEPKITVEAGTNKKNKPTVTILSQFNDKIAYIVLLKDKELQITIGNNSTKKTLKSPFNHQEYAQILQEVINQTDVSDVEKNPREYIDKAFNELGKPKETTPPPTEHKEPVSTESTSSTAATEPTTRKVVQLKSNESGQIDIYLFDKDPSNDDDYDYNADDQICTLSFTDTDKKQCTVTFKDGTTKVLTSTSAFNSDMFIKELQKLIDESKTADYDINKYITKALTSNSPTSSKKEEELRLIMPQIPDSPEENPQPIHLPKPPIPSSNNPSICLAPQATSSQSKIIQIRDTKIVYFFDEKNPNFPMKLIIYTDQAPDIKWYTNFNINPDKLIDILLPEIQRDLTSNPIAFDVIINNLSLYIMQNPTYFYTEGFLQCIGDAVVQCIPSTKPEFPLMLILSTKPDPNLFPLKFQGRLINPLFGLRDMVNEMQKANSIHSSAFNAAIMVLDKYGAPVLDILRPPYEFHKVIGDATIHCIPSKNPQFPWELTISSDILKQSWKITFNIEPVNFLHYLIAYLENETLPQGLTKFEAAIYCAKRELGIRE